MPVYRTLVQPKVIHDRGVPKLSKTVKRAIAKQQRERNKAYQKWVKEDEWYRDYHPLFVAAIAAGNTIPDADTVARRAVEFLDIIKPKMPQDLGYAEVASYSGAGALAGSIVDDDAAGYSSEKTKT
jgi:hypothetical protein